MLTKVRLYHEGPDITLISWTIIYSNTWVELQANVKSGNGILLV